MEENQGKKPIKITSSEEQKEKIINNNSGFEKKSKNAKKLLWVFIVTIMIVVVYIIVNNISADIETIKDSVVMIETYDEYGELISTGSGFCVYKNNYIVTNFHVIKGARKIKIIDDNKKEYDVSKVEIIKSGDDLAILSGNYTFTPLKIENKKLKAGDEVICIGSPKGELNTVSTGIVSNADDEFEIRITAPISPGSSGGVLLNNKHKVIGITYAGYNSLEAQNINYAINVKYLEEMYKKLNSGECLTLANSPYTDIDSSVKESILDTYYYVDSLENFYEYTSTKKKFEKILKEKDYNWYKIFNKLTIEEKYECVSILEDFQKEQGSQDTKILKRKSELIKEYSLEEIAYNIAVKKYQYAIILEKASNLTNEDEFVKMIDSLPIKGGQKTILKFCLVYNDIDKFSDSVNKELINYLFEDKYNSGYNSDAAVALLERMGYKVTNNGETYTITWK